jgi:putative phosphoesterase
MTKRIECQKHCLIGVISDTHGYVAPAVLKAFADADLILHAGDIGEPDVLKALKNIAPLVAVRGNMDFGKWANCLPQEDTVEIGGTCIHVIHDVQRLRTGEMSSGVSAIVFGHSHRRLARETEGIYYLNPGSASYPKYGESASVALLHLQNGKLDTEFISISN